MPPSGDRRHATSWSSSEEGSRYELGRPGYPDEVGRLIVAGADAGAGTGSHRQQGAGAGRLLVDLAAGTGKLTRVIAATGARVVAVEPMPGMRRQLRAVLPGLAVVAGTAESLGLRTGSVGAVTVAQAAHWFDWPRAAPELHRVLAADGRLVIVTNGRDPQWPAVDAVAAILERYEALGPRPPTVGRWREAFADTGAFEVADRFEVAHAQVFSDLDAFDARWASVSFAILMPEDRRAAMLADLREAVAAADVDPLVVPLRTTVELYRPVPGAVSRS